MSKNFDPELITKNFKFNADFDADFVNTVMSDSFKDSMKIKSVDISKTPEEKFVDDVRSGKNTEGTKFYKALVEFLHDNKVWSPDLNRDFNKSMMDYISVMHVEERENRQYLKTISSQFDKDTILDMNKFLDRYYEFIQLSVFEDIYRIDSLDFNKLPKSFKEYNNFKVFYIAPHVHNQFQEDKVTNPYKDFCEHKYNDFISQLEKAKGTNKYADVKVLTDKSKQIENKVAKNRDILNEIVRGNVETKEDLDLLSL